MRVFVIVLVVVPPPTRPPTPHHCVLPFLSCVANDGRDLSLVCVLVLAVLADVSNIVLVFGVVVCN